MDTKHRSFLRRIFGDDVGEIMEFMVGLPVLFAVVMVVTQIPSYISQRMQKPSEEARILTQLPASSRELVKDLAEVQTKTQQLLTKLESDAKAAESLVEQKKKALADLQTQIDLLQLTPEQRKAVEDYNRSVSRDMGFGEWLSRRVTWYERGAAFLLSLFFFWLGRRSGRARARAGDTPLTGAGDTHKAA